MKNIFWFLFICFFFTNCKKELPIPIQPESPPTEEAVETPVAYPTVRGEVGGIDRSYLLIDTIFNKSYSSTRPNGFTRFIYNDKNQLTEVRPTNSYITRAFYRYDDRNRLVEKLEPLSSFGQDNSAIKYRRDSITYNEHGKIARTYDFYDKDRNDDIDLVTLNIITQYDYNPLGQCIRVGRVDVQTNEYRLQQSFEWRGDNISKFSLYSDNEPLYELRFEYDDAPNFMHNHPHYYDWFRSWNANNIVRSQATDYSGLYDPACYDCNYEYEYDDLSRPIYRKLLTFYQPPVIYISYKN